MWQSVRMITSFHSRTNRHSALPNRCTYWILLDSPITIFYQKQHCSRARSTQTRFFGFTKTFQVGLVWTAGEELRLWKLMSCTLAQMNKSIFYWHHVDFPFFFWTFKVLFYALGEFFSQGHPISETDFVCSQLSRKGKDEKIIKRKGKKKRERKPTTLRNI